MKTLFRIVKYVLVLVIVLLIALLAFAATFDANNYKPQIIEQVEKATGRDFSIAGDINLSVFPWIGLKVEDVSLGNEKGFSAKQFAAIKQLDIKVNVLPLLKKEVEINTIRLHGLNLALEVAKDKSNNWSGLAQAEAAATEAPAATAEPTATAETLPAEKAGLPLQSLMVEGFEFVDATILYDDRSTNTRATVSDLNLKTGAIQFEQPVAVSFSAHIKNEQPAIDSRLKLSTNLTFNKEFSIFNLSDFVFTVVTSANEFIKQEEQLEIKTSIDVAMDEQRVVINQLQLSAMGTTTIANFSIMQFLQTPLIQGDIEVQPFNAREVAKRAGVVLPAMAKADALHEVALKTRIKLQGEKLDADDFSLKLDSSTLSGWLHVINIGKQQLRYDLAFDKITIDDYLPPVVEPTAGDKPAVAAPGAETAAAAVSSTGDEKIELPLELIRKLDVQGDFRITSLTAKKYDIKQFAMTTTAQSGEIDIKPLSMQLLDGQVTSAVKINAQKDIPSYNINLDVSQLQAGPVANPFLVGIMGDKPLTMEGAVNLVAGIKTTGETVNQLKKASKGQIVLDMNETAVHGFDPEFYMRSSVAGYLSSKGFGESTAITGNYKPRQVTVFDTIHSTVNLADGKARTDDFLMDSLRVQVKAKGYVDIMQNAVDVTSSVRLPRGQTALEKVLDEPMYVHVHGPFAALQYELDTDRLKKSTTDVLENEAKAKLDAEKQRLKEKAEAEKQRLKDKADEERARAEEKAKQQLKDSTEKYQDKLKDKLKGLF
jgi:AsmA protein